MDILTMVAGMVAMNAMDEAEEQKAELERLREENEQLREAARRRESWEDDTL